MSREDNLNSDTVVSNRKADIQLDFYHFVWQPHCEYVKSQKKLLPKYNWISLVNVNQILSESFTFRDCIKKKVFGFSYLIQFGRLPSRVLHQAIIDTE